ncbi:hypothetical protein [Arundinibacter roseus]|uniref:Glycosyltransferase RgtA/B/C/D-like domain-containing protein n=1 Tax=Arundinibacter roseus TaxID=2070510 RepID=A0A4V2X8S2_9BACT|nr:hypothetical protein [Arundinibacter roseus]TDB60875.1 hypothetical protein EZE20_20750 [Arundinibacter roseus]
MEPQPILTNQYAGITLFVQKHTQSKYWLWQLTGICTLLSWFLAVPPYTVGLTSDAWAFVQIQAADLLHPHHLEVYIRRENMIMRWMLPFVYTLTGRSVIGVLVLQAVLGFIFLYLSSREVFRVTQDKVLTTFFALAFANIFVFSWFLIDLAGYGDSFGYFFLLMAMLFRNPVLIFISMQGAFFTDERGVIASAYVVLWWVVQYLFKKTASERSSLVTIFQSAFTPQVLAILAAMAAYVPFRSFIMNNYFPDHAYTTIGTPVLFADLHRWGLGNSLWTSFEGMWLLMGAAVLVLYKTRNYWYAAACAFGFLILLVTGLLVHDVDRAFGYGFPFILIANRVLSYYVPRHEHRKLMFIIALICLISPMCYTLGYNKIIWAEPLPMKALMMLDRQMGWGWFD